MVETHFSTTTRWQFRFHSIFRDVKLTLTNKHQYGLRKLPCLGGASLRFPRTRFLDGVLRPSGRRTAIAVGRTAAERLKRMPRKWRDLLNTWESIHLCGCQ